MAHCCFVSARRDTLFFGAGKLRDKAQRDCGARPAGAQTCENCLAIDSAKPKAKELFQLLRSGSDDGVKIEHFGAWLETEG
jgi:hypothetical protein